MVLNEIVTFIASEAYGNVCVSVTKEIEMMTINSVVTNDYFLLKQIKANASLFANIDKLVIDLSALRDLDDEIIEAIDTLRFLDEHLGIIILATNRMAGDPLLKQIFQMGIYDIVCSTDYQVIRDELGYCLVTGKNYKDAIAFKATETTERVVVKTEVRKAIGNVLIGLVGAGERVGCTYTGIHMAAALRKMGYMVAVVECNQYHPVFEALRSEYDEKVFQEGYFSIEGIHFYMQGEEAVNTLLASGAYNFIICDFGAYEKCDQILFHRCQVRLIQSGSCAWDILKLNDVLEAYKADMEVLQGFQFLFTFAEEQRKNDIRDILNPIACHFVEYEPDLFQDTFAGTKEILKEYISDGIPKKKKIFSFGKKK